MFFFFLKLKDESQQREKTVVAEARILARVYPHQPRVVKREKWGRRGHLLEVGGMVRHAKAESLILRRRRYHRCHYRRRHYHRIDSRALSFSQLRV